MTRRKLRLLLVSGILLAVSFSSWFFVDRVARCSSFCGNCHYMEPFVEQWRHSTHQNVACVQCHPAERREMFAQLVKYMTRTYSPRPKAYVPDEACSSSNCHVDMAKRNAVKFLSVSFPHQPHLGVDRRGIRLHCASCHGASQEAGHVSVDARICYLCHFKGQPVGGTLTWCGSCHGAPTGMSQHGGFTFDMKLYSDSGVECSRCHVAVHEGEGAVSKDKCFTCHVSRVDAMSNSKALHNKHVGEREIRCLECHEPIQHGNIKMLSVLDVSCESCHQNLHAGPKEMYLGVGAKGAPATPSRMFAAQINCTGCHTQVTVQGSLSFLGQGNKTANPKACAACHDARYIPMVGRWKEQGRILIAEAQRLATEGERLAVRTESRSELQNTVSQLKFNARFLEQGQPVHNIEYAIKTVQASAALVNTLAGKSEERLVASAIRPAFARDAFSYCSPACHTFIPRKEPYTFKGVDFPHSFHVQKASLPCETCHKENRHKELVLATTSDCASCHHTSPKINCARCHVRQAALYTGKLPPFLGVTAKPDGMAAAVGCADCHDPTLPEPIKQVSKACVACHEAKGAKDFDWWNQTLQAAQQKIQRQEDEARILLNGLKRQGVGLTTYRTRLDAILARMDYLEKAKGVHNMTASQLIFEKSERELSELLQEMNRAAGTAPRAAAKNR